MTKEQIEIIKNVKSLDELIQKAKESNIVITKEELEKIYNSFHNNLELSSEELDNVTGGCGDEPIERKWVVSARDICADGFKETYESAVFGTKVFDYESFMKEYGFEPRCMHCDYIVYEGARQYCGK